MKDIDIQTLGPDWRLVHTDEARWSPMPEHEYSVSAHAPYGQVTWVVAYFEPGARTGQWIEGAAPGESGHVHAFSAAKAAQDHWAKHRGLRVVPDTNPKDPLRAIAQMDAAAAKRSREEGGAQHKRTTPKWADGLVVVSNRNLYSPEDSPGAWSATVRAPSEGSAPRWMGDLRLVRARGATRRKALSELRGKVQRLKDKRAGKGGPRPKKRNPSMEDHAENYRHNIDRAVLYLDLAYQSLRRIQAAPSLEEGQRLGAIGCEEAYAGLDHLAYAQMESWNLEGDSALWDQAVKPTLDQRAKIGRFFYGLLHLLGCPPPVPDFELTPLLVPGALEAVYAEVQAGRTPAELAQAQKVEAEAAELVESILSGDLALEPDDNPVGEAKRRLLAFDFGSR